MYEFLACKGQTMKTGNIGVITTQGQALQKINSIDENGLLYCVTLETPARYSVCTAAEFWVLLDSFE